MKIDGNEPRMPRIVGSALSVTLKKQKKKIMQNFDVNNDYCEAYINLCRWQTQSNAKATQNASEDHHFPINGRGNADPGDRPQR